MRVIMLVGYDRRAVCEQVRKRMMAKERPQAAQKGHTLVCTYNCGAHHNESVVILENDEGDYVGRKRPPYSL